MTDFGQELGSLDFENIIGGPLTAVVEAQAHAAETSIEFINEVGLTFEDGRITPIKTVFSYQKESTDELGITRSRTHNIEVPVLAIVPIPYMVFNDVWLNFNVNLNSVENRSHNSFTGGSIAGRGRFGGFSFSGSVAASRQKRDTGTVSKTYAMGVKIHAVQDEMPEGMERVLNILEQVAKAEVKPYNAVKAITNPQSGNAMFEQGVEYGGDGAITSWAFDQGSGYGGMTTIDFRPKVDMPSTSPPSATDTPLRWQDVPEITPSSNIPDDIKILQRWLNAVGSKDSVEQRDTFDAKEGSPYITKTSAGSLLQDDGLIGRKTMQSLIRYAESALLLTEYVAASGSTAASPATFEAVGTTATGAQVFAAVDELSTYLLTSKYEATASTWKDSAHASETTVQGFIGAGNRFGNNAKTGLWGIITQLREDYIETLGRRPPTLRLTIPSGGSAGSFSMSIIDGGKCLSGHDHSMTADPANPDKCKIGSVIQNVKLTDDANPGLDLTVDVVVGANGTLESVVWSGVANAPSVPGKPVLQFQDVPLFSTNGIGVGALANLTIENDRVVSCTLGSSAGVGYAVGEILTVDNSILSTNGNGFQITVETANITEDSAEATYLARGTGGTGTGLEVRVTVSGGTASYTYDIVDGGRDYTIGDIVTLTAVDSGGSIEVEITQVG